MGGAGPAGDDGLRGLSLGRLSSCQSCALVGVTWKDAENVFLSGSHLFWSFTDPENLRGSCTQILVQGLSKRAHNLLVSLTSYVNTKESRVTLASQVQVYRIHEK